jgi:CheY-like chemotaxis protein
MNSCQHILVVDDDLEDQLILLEYFKDCGKEQQVKFFKNGLETINYLAEIPLDGTLPKLIVLDLNMPILNGTQTLLQIKRNQRFKNIPVIIFSTSENENEKRKCMSFGAEEYLVKPSTFNDGLRMIKKFTDYMR